MFYRIHVVKMKTYKVSRLWALLERHATVTLPAPLHFSHPAVIRVAITIFFVGSEINVFFFDVLFSKGIIMAAIFAARVGIRASIVVCLLSQPG